MSPLPPVLVGVPATSVMFTRATEAMLALELPRGSVWCFMHGPSNIAAKRNMLVQQLLGLARGIEWLFFLDSDMLPPPATVRQLLAAEREVVGAWYCTREPPQLACAGWHAGGALRRADPQGGRQRVDFVGTGALLLHRSVFARVPEPWFEHPVDEPLLADDAAFCRKLGRAGIPIWCDTDLVAGHLRVAAVPPAAAAGRWPDDADRAGGVIMAGGPP